MDLQTAMHTLESLGSEQTRKTYRRHGAGENTFGVKFGDLYKLKKQIKIDHPLALALWETGNTDARSLATMIVDPKQVTNELLDAWLKEADGYGQIDQVVSVAIQTPWARAKAEEWYLSDDEKIGRAGWHLIGALANNDKTLPDAYFEPYLALIERDIHQAKNRTRQAMNNTLIAIGSRNAALELMALNCAAAVGKVNIDHGDTGCKTPDAAQYIKKARAHSFGIKPVRRDGIAKEPVDLHPA